MTNHKDKGAFILNLTGQGIDERMFARYAKALEDSLKRALPSLEISQPTAGPPKPGEKGEPITVTTLLLAGSTSGAITALIECFKAIFARERKLVIDVETNDGRKVTLSARNVDMKTVQDMLCVVLEP